MKWLPLEKMLGPLRAPEGITIEQLSRKDVPELIKLLREWYPDIQSGSESCQLDENYYYNEVALKEVSEDRKIYAMLFKKGNELVGYMGTQKDNAAKTISARLAVLSPKYRGIGIGPLGPMIQEQFGRVIGAELTYYFATLSTPHQQKLAEKTGHTLVGIVPAFDRDTIAPGVTKRVYEAIYAKVLVDKSEIQVPDLSTFTERTRKVWDVLFQEEN